MNEQYLIEQQSPQMQIQSGAQDTGVLDDRDKEILRLREENVRLRHRLQQINALSQDLKEP